MWNSVHVGCRNEIKNGGPMLSIEIWWVQIPPAPPPRPSSICCQIYARVLDYSYLCDYGISKFSGGACPQIPPARRALPILCLGVKLSSPPIQNHKKPLGVSHTKRSWSGAVRAPRSADCFPRCLSGAQQWIWQV